MKLYEYYKLRTNEDGKPELYTIPDPLPQDGYSYEPLAYASDDDDYDEEYVAKLKLPFTGITCNFSGDHGEINEAGIVGGVDTVTVDFAQEFVDMYAKAYSMSTKENDFIFYRTGIYFENEEYTGFDMVYVIILD